MDFRLKVFVTVARRLSFTKASKDLYISQPAITKHIQELESAYTTQLFDRSGGHISLTKAGEIFLKHAEHILDSYKELQFEMNLLSGNFSGNLHVGASTTIAQYVIPSILAQYISVFPNVNLSLLTGNSEQVELALEERRIDIGIVEGSSKKQELRYSLFAKDELVLVTHTKNKAKDEINIEELKSLPLVLRETGSGTLEVIERALNKQHLKVSQMNVLLYLGSTESIKSFLLSYPSAYAIISISAVAKELAEGKLRVVDIKDMELQRDFSFILPSGYQNPITEKFMEFARKNHNKKL